MTSPIEQRFKELSEKWHLETRFISSSTIMINNYHYQEIIALGSEVVPIILRSLEGKPEHWFYALSSITGENPVSHEDRGNLTKMTDAWINWGKEKGLI